MALDLESSKIPEAKKTVDEINRTILEYEKKGDEIKISVKERIDEIHREVDKLGESVLTTLENQRKKDIQQMQVTKKKVSDNVTDMEKRAKTCRSAPADASLLLLKNNFTCLEPKQLISVELPGTITFEKSKLNLPSSADFIGRIATGKKINIDTSLKMIEMKVIKTLENKRGDTILHMRNGQTWVLNEYAKSISIIGKQYNQIKEINLGFTCRDMTLTQAQEVIATDFSNHRIVRISISGSITTLCSTAPLRPCGICVNNKQQIMVGVGRVGQNVHSKLVMYSSDGSSVLQEMEYDRFGKQLFTGEIFRVRQTVSGDYVVTDNVRVICLSNELKVKWQYDVGSHVYGLCCDKYDNVIVADGNMQNEIIMLSIEGKLIKTLLTQSDGIRAPFSLSVDSNGLLWVGQRENTLVIQYMK